eukprot:371788-Rhodomonas_salina.2
MPVSDMAYQYRTRRTESVSCSARAVLTCCTVQMLTVLQTASSASTNTAVKVYRNRFLLRACYAMSGTDTG